MSAGWRRYNLGLPRKDRAWLLHHDERVLDLSRKVLVKLADVTAHVLVLSPFVRPFLNGEPLPKITVELAKVPPQLKPWGPMVLPDILASVRHYYQSSGAGLSEMNNVGLRVKNLIKIVGTKGAALTPAMVTYRLSMQGAYAAKPRHPTEPCHAPQRSRAMTLAL